MSLILRSSDNFPRLVMKGASEIVLESCERIHLFNNEIVNLDDNMKSQCLEAINAMAKNALRTLALAYKELSPNESF